MSTLEEIQAARAARKEAKAAREQEQLVEDLTAINELEIEHGDENIATLRVDRYIDGLPVMIAVRAPKPVEVKRFRSRMKQRNADAHAACEEVGRACLLYPNAETFDKLAEHRPMLPADSGGLAIQILRTRSESEGKE